MSLKGDLAKELLSQFPDTPSRTLAQMLFFKYPEVYTDEENARDIVRYHRGARGDRMRREMTSTEHVRPLQETSNPFPAMPKGLKHFDEWKPIVLEEERTLVLADMHVPYHDEDAIEIAVAEGLRADVTGVLLLGDVHDMYSCSFWENDPRKRDFQRELDMGRDVYAHLRGRFPKLPIRMKFGNHEERYARVMAVKAPQFYGVDSFQFAQLMHLEQYGIELIEDRRILKVGKLHLVHGHEFGRSIFSPVNPARGLYLRGKENALCGHWHVTSDHTEKSMGEKVIRCWSAGCLCDLHPDYAPINKWNHGYAIVHNLGNGAFKVDNNTIIEGRVY